MRLYEVYGEHIPPIRIEAEKIISYSVGDKPIRIKFLVKDETVMNWEDTLKL